MPQKQYTIVLTRPQGGKMSDATVSLLDESNAPVVMAKADVSGTASLMLHSFLGGILNFKIFNKTDSLVGSVRVVFKPVKSFEVYDEPQHTLRFKLHIPFSFTKEGLAVTDPNGKELWRLESGGGGGLGILADWATKSSIVNALYKSPGHEQIGGFVLDFQSKKHMVSISDESFPPVLILAMFLIANEDLRAKGQDWAI